jgi:hypothetical protein
MVGRLATKSVREVQAWWYFEVVESGEMVGFSVRLFPGIDLGSVPPIAEIEGLFRGWQSLTMFSHQTVEI